MASKAKIASFKLAWTARLAQTRQRLFARTPHNAHRAFQLTRRGRWGVTPADAVASWRLLTDTWRFIWQKRRIMVSFGVLYALLAYFLVGGISQLDYVTFKDASAQVVNGDLGAFGTAFSMFGAAITGNLNAPPSETQQFLSAALMILFWLSIVWAARMLSADKSITLRDAFYNSGGPVIPTLVVLAVVSIQLIPAAIGIFGYAVAVNGGWLSGGGVEAMVFAAVALLLVLLSAYLVVSSLTGLVIVALPGTYPWQALRTARQLVMNRRWAVVLRALALLLHVVLLWGVVLIPVFLLDGWLRFDWLPLVPVVVQALVGMTLVYTSVYLYKLYRSLL